MIGKLYCREIKNDLVYAVRVTAVHEQTSLSPAVLRGWDKGEKTNGNSILDLIFLHIVLGFFC